MAIEYTANSSQKNGVKNSNRKVRIGGSPWAMLSTAISAPVLKRTKLPQIGPIIGTNIIRV